MTQSKDAEFAMIQHALAIAEHSARAGSVEKILAQEVRRLEAENAKLRDALMWLESLSEDGPVALGTVVDEEGCVYRIAAAGLTMSGSTLLNAVDLHKRGKMRRAAQVLAETNARGEGKP